MDVKEEEILGEAVGSHWYYVAKGRAIRSLLGDYRTDEVLDVGAGSGVFSQQLMEAGVCSRACCVDTAYTNDGWHKTKPIEYRRRISSPDHRLVLMIDVLEHVSDDLALLREYTDAIPAGSRVVLSVPAFQFLWSGHDVFLEHFRRYTLGELERLVARAELNILRSRYFFGALFPAVALLRLFRGRIRADEPATSDLRVYAPPLNRALIAIHDAERWTLLPINRLAGLSVLCVAEK
ncbi:MAG: methyltransferase domain-containing protein [Pseudomonadota bacterium]